jgi:hypothetical protein
MGFSPQNCIVMNRDSNGYTFLFAAAMVLVVASTLAFTASSLKSLQADNVRKEKMQKHSINNTLLELWLWIIWGMRTKKWTPSN